MIPQDLPPPSRNPSDDDTLNGVLRLVLAKFLQGLDDMLPAKVISYDRASNTAQVQPLISMLTTDNKIIQRAPIMSVPVQQVGGGNFMSNNPMQPNDLGFIKANDRDISLFKQSLQSSIPNTSRKHSFSDAVFLPFIMGGFVIADSDAARYVLQTLTGSIRLSMGTDNVLISDDMDYSCAVGAVLDVQSTKGAFKFPTMTTTQKNAIPTPMAGFAVWDTTLNALSTYNGSMWS